MTKTQQERAIHKKRYGQYFSGKAIADRLFSLLPQNRKWKTVVDPMSGIGDMLVSASEHSDNSSLIMGVEIDADIAIECSKRVPAATIICKDAFKSNELLLPDGWDLVITNPPYVRYQLQNLDDSVMPTGQEIRSNLINQIQSISYLSLEEKAFFLRIAKNYSGLADMAVPAWILCAALVKQEGYLAIVVPETWLNRDYAAPIQYLLNKCFRIETIVHDTNASWFSDALVKTCLVIAKRKMIQPILEISDQKTQIQELDKTIQKQTISIFPNMFRGKDVEKWITDEDRALIDDSEKLPHEMRDLLEKEDRQDYISLTDLGLYCGQGLRTGANDFFYLAIKEHNDGVCIVKSQPWDSGGQEYSIRDTEIIPTLRNRGEIQGLVVDPDCLEYGVLYLSEVAHDAAADYIHAAEQYKDKQGRRFKEFSAVKPNERIDNNQIIRHWYNLPKLSRRHLPNLCMTRISSKASECLYVPQSSDRMIAIDANMITMWSNDNRSVLISMALLNSTWCKLFLELSCTVMGGGALKIEASHLKKLLVPKFDDHQLTQLEQSGSLLIESRYMTNDIQDQIDRIVFSSYGDSSIEKARELMNQKVSERRKR
ncbi:MAG: N-6 DNA methylase [Ruminococcus sp.]|nr:N-6 DNA methylase [Ruminococcus sp.]